MISTKNKLTYITLFPQLIESYFSDGLLSRAEKSGLIEKKLVNLRDFSKNKYKSVDGKSYGGGDGMVMSVEPVALAIESVASPNSNHTKKIILMSPQGRKFSQSVAQELSTFDELVFVCGRYAGFDHRVEAYCDDQISIGDYVLSGGELAALVISEATMRLVPGFLGNDQSGKYDSFSMNQEEDSSIASGLLEAPQFTEPTEFRGKTVPPILLSGNHQKIRDWKTGMGLITTLVKRPDLVKVPLSKKDYDLAISILKEFEVMKLEDQKSFQSFLGPVYSVADLKNRLKDLCRP